MEPREDYVRVLCLLLCLSIATIFFSQCEAKRPPKNALIRGSKKLRPAKRLEEYSSSDPYDIGSPYSLPPYGEVMGPSSSPTTNPPYCVNPPLIPSPPSAIIPSPPFTAVPSPPSITMPAPTSPFASPPPPTEQAPSPPGTAPSPPEFGPSPPVFGPSPPELGPTPPGVFPSPPVFVPGPPIFLPPVVYPPPLAPPPPPEGVTLPGLWCVAKPTVPDPIIQEAMDYACGSGADCDSIEPSGRCYQPATLLAHASYAFNSYWQRTKVAGGTCDFGGTAMLITRDPSYDGCRFTLS